MYSLNNSSDNSTVPDQWKGVFSILSYLVLCLSFLVGVPGNFLVIWTVFWHAKQRCLTMTLVLHLAIADLLVLITLPFWIYSLAHSWVFGEASCNSMVYIINSCMYSSVFLITAMSVERFVAVRYPLKLMSLKFTNAKNKALAVIWVLAFLFGIPAILTKHIDEICGKQQCFSWEYSSLDQEVAHMLVETLVGFVIPLLVLSFCYHQVGRRLSQMRLRSKRKSSFLIFGVFAIFCICWLPHHFSNLVSLFGHLAGEEGSKAVAVFIQESRLIAGALACISSSVNPVLYAFMAQKFQGSLRSSGLARLFQEMSSHTSEIKESANPSSDMRSGCPSHTMTSDLV